MSRDSKASSRAGYYGRILRILLGFRVPPTLITISWAVLIGAAVGFSAALFQYAFDWVFYNITVKLTFSYRIFYLILPTAGALLSAIIIYRFSPLSRGGGVDVYIEAFHYRNGYLPLSLSLYKSITTILTIATGGSGGKEGPITLIGASIGSAMGRWFGIPRGKMRLFLVIGAASGAAAIFRLPIGGAFFAVEVLYRGPDMEVEDLGYVIIASVISYAVFGLFHGWEPVFRVPGVSFRVGELPFYFLLAVFVSLMAVVFIQTQRFIASIFGKIRAGYVEKAVLGAFLTGTIIYFFPQVAGDSYDYVQSVLFGRVPLQYLVLVIALKMIATGLTLKSGNSGGYFAPSVVIGALSGNLFARLLYSWGFIDSVSIPAFTVIGMAGFFSAVSNTPMASVFMALELAGKYHLVLPALVVSFLSFFLNGYRGLFEKQLFSRFQSPAHEDDLRVDILERVRVRDIPLRRDIVYLDYYDTLEHALHLATARLDQTTFPVLKGDRVVGFIFERDIKDMLLEGAISNMGRAVLVADVMKAIVPRITPEMDLHSVLKMLIRYGYDELPVFDNGQFIGIISREDILRAYDRIVGRESS